MEKNIDVVIDRRFKKLGMNWTTEGANNLVKLQALSYNSDRYEFWLTQACYGVVFPQQINSTHPILVLFIFLVIWYNAL